MSNAGCRSTPASSPARTHRNNARAGGCHPRADASSDPRRRDPLWEPLQRRSRGSGPVLGKHPIAAEAAPTVTVTPTLSCPRARGALPSTRLSARKSRRVPPSGPVAAGEGSEWKKSPQGAGHGGPAVSAETGGRIGNLHSQSDPARRAIDKRPLFAALPFRVAAGVAPRVVPAGSCDVARRAKARPKASPHERSPKEPIDATFKRSADLQSGEAATPSCFQG